MRYLLAAVLWLGLTTRGNAFDRARVLLSDFTVLCSPNTPPATVRHLVETWGALLCVIDRGVPMDPQLEPWVAMHLTAGSDSISTVDSLRAWNSRLGLTTAVLTDDPWLAATAQAAGFAVFVQTPEFQPGALALRDNRGYVYYAGPKPVFFERRGLLVDIVGRSRLPDAWGDLARTLSAEFSTGSDTSEARWHTLLKATRRAAALSSEPGTPSELRAYDERWSICLGWWLAPTLAADTLHLFMGQEASHPVQLLRGDGTVTLDGIHSESQVVRASWEAALPVLINRDTMFASGFFHADQAGTFQWTGRFEFSFEDVQLVRNFSLPVQVVAAFQAALTPAVLFLDGEEARQDPDYQVSVLAGQIELLNRSSEPLEVHVNWRADAPVSISSSTPDVALGPGERKRTGFTVNVPRDSALKDFAFGADVIAQGVSSPVAGKIWSSAPAKVGLGRVRIVGASGAWLSALSDLGLEAEELAPGTVRGALNSVDAVVVRGGVSPAGEADVHAVADFVADGGVAILEIERDALKWLPWQVGTIRKPAPFAASFYKENLAWWQAPNELVGGCFAALHRDSVLTLSAGENGWEALVVDDVGKGFMYRRKSGRGWFVLVHAGWWPRLDQVERRAHLGLFNLVSAGSP